VGAVARLVRGSTMTVNCLVHLGEIPAIGLGLSFRVRESVVAERVFGRPDEANRNQVG
jgi:hypothetical protein